MGNTKIDFINDLLSSKKIKIEEKSRILELTKSELNNFDSTNDDIVKRIENIEEILKVADKYNSVSTLVNTVNDIDLQKINEQVKKPSKTKSKVTYHINCNNVPKFLKTLNRNSYTKYLTHPIDSNDHEELIKLFDQEYDYLFHLKKIKEIFSVLTETDCNVKEKYPELKKISISINLYNKIKNYIYGEDVWGEEKIKMNWSHSELLKWCEENKGRVPSPDSDMNYTGFKFEDKTFKDIVLRFKNEIHIRKNNPLNLILTEVLFNPKNDFRNKMNIERELDESIEFFTDVEKLKELIKQILALIVEKNMLNNKPTVKISSKIINGKIQLSILSFKNIINSNIATFRFGKTTPNLMKNCNGICDIEIDAQFLDYKFYRIPIWKKGRKIENDIIYDGNKEFNPSASITKLTEPINGVLFKLTFDM